MKETKFDINKYLRENKIEMGIVDREVGSSTYKGGTNDLRKTKYDVKLTEAGKLDLYTHKTTLAEGIKYPSQDEAEAMVDWTNHTNAVYFGGAPMVRKAFTKADSIRINLWRTIFGENSPWIVARSGNKLVVKWDKQKAEKIGITENVKPKLTEALSPKQSELMKALFNTTQKFKNSLSKKEIQEVLANLDRVYGH